MLGRGVGGQVARAHNILFHFLVPLSVRSFRQNPRRRPSYSSRDRSGLRILEIVDLNLEEESSGSLKNQNTQGGKG
jgi:hypothetical protein